ncbi:uncharacterized protein LOC119725186 [Patiria miniata]|uniref:Uncharacterized protein n=1 Tax=Patiria miniata TaxID=46514 RepID=A0A913ZMZ0_PATMI|nr:uncharacterized protein LOC119725186 [Patiria miniata]
MDASFPHGHQETLGTRNACVTSESTDSESDQRQSQKETRLEVPAGLTDSAPPRDDSQTRETKSSRRGVIYLAVVVLVLGAVLLIAGLAVFLVFNFTASDRAQANRVTTDFNITDLTTVLPNATLYQPNSSSATSFGLQTPPALPSADPSADATTSHQVSPSAQPTDVSTHQVSPSAQSTDLATHQVSPSAQPTDLSTHQVSPSAQPSDLSTHQVSTSAQPTDLSTHQHSPSAQPTDLSTNSMSEFTTYLRTTTSNLHPVGSTIGASTNPLNHPQITHDPPEATTAISTTSLIQTETCTHTEFSCLLDGLCIPTINVCDDVQNCNDESDENNCYNGPVCQGRHFTFSLDLDEVVTITSPRFPASYTLYEECHWFLTRPPGTSFIIDIIHFDVPIPDAVAIYEIESGFRRLVITMHESLGQGLKMAFESQDLEVLFVSSYNTHGTGFNFSVRAVHNDEYIICDVPPYVYGVEDVCNDFSDCPDDTDEKECECDENEFRCNSGVCVNGGIDVPCSGSAQCRDFSDEGLECHEIYCVDIHHSACAVILPYNRTFYPNDRADSLEDAYTKLSALEKQLSSNCAASIRLAACILLFPECPRFKPTQTVCRRFCDTNLSTCLASVVNADWLSCDMLPDVEMRAGSTCMYDEDDLLHTGICGTRQTNPLSRIVGGVASDITTWPWIGSLRDEYSEHRCGATLITNQWAATAAHCVGFFDRIVLGSTDLHGTPATRREIIIDKVIAHPFYDAVNLDNDIALIKLRARVEFSDDIRPACLNTVQNETYLFDNCYVAGWGHTSAGGAVSFDLQEAILPLVPRDICQYQSNSPHLVSSNQLCAGFSEGGVDTCQGDSGGPLVCLGADDRWKLVGVTSSGNAACGAPQSPGIYTRVSRYLDFIRQTIAADRTDDCTAGQFQCEGQIVCVPDSVVCDDNWDCADGSDELYCS